MKLTKYRVTLIILVVNLIVCGILIKLTLDDFAITNEYSGNTNAIRNDYNDTIEKVDKSLYDLKSGIPDRFANYNPVDGSTFGQGFPNYELWVDKNGTVNRTSQDNLNVDLTLVCSLNGEIFLERNANAETQYTPNYSQPGVYEYYLKAIVNEDYRVVSNVVSFNK